jgi:proline iminopeptidase
MLVVHGGPGLDHTYLRPWLDPLSVETRVVYSDLLGCGKSDRVPLEGGMELWAEGIEQLRASLGIDRMILLGHGFGGYVAQEYALRHADRLDGLVLASTGPAFDYESAMASVAVRATPEQLAALQGGLGTAPGGKTPDDQAFRRAWTSVLPLYFAHYRAQIGAAMDARTSYSAAAFAFGMTRCLPTWSVADRLGKMRTPTLVLSGGQDWMNPVAKGGQQLAAGIPGAKHIVFEESGHFPFIEEQHAFLGAVRAWLTGLPH